MVIKYKLNFYGEDDDYAYLISKVLEHTDSNVIRAGDEIIIYMQGDEESIKASFAALGEHLPISLYLGEQSVEEAAMMPPNRQELRKVSYLGMYPGAARELIDESSPKYFVVNGGVSLGSELASDETKLQNALKEVVRKIKEGKKIAIQNEQNEYVLQAAPTRVVLLTNLTQKNLQFFGISTQEAISLSAMERPFLAKFDANGERLFCFANDELLLLLSKVATDDGVDALYVESIDGFDEKLRYEMIKGDAPVRKVVYHCGADRFFLNEEFAPKSLDADGGALFFDMNVTDNFGVYAVKERGVAKKIANASFCKASPMEAIEERFDFGVRLCANFSSAFTTETTALKAFDAEGEAIKDFFEAASLALGIDGGFWGLLSAASDANIEGGVKLDFILQKNEEGVSLDLLKCLSSLLSYRIAGVESSTLAYSIFESAVDFLINAQDEAKKSFSYAKLCIGGEFLFSKVFVSKLKAKIKNIDIEMALNYLPPHLKEAYESAK